MYVAEKAEVEAALGSLAAADSLYDRATDLIDGLLVNAQTSRMKTEMIAAVGDIYVRASAGVGSPSRSGKGFPHCRKRPWARSLGFDPLCSPVQSPLGGDPRRPRDRPATKGTCAGGFGPQRHKVLDKLDHAYFWMGPTEFAQSRKEMELSAARQFRCRQFAASWPLTKA